VPESGGKTTAKSAASRPPKVDETKNEGATFLNITGGKYSS
jgi:hypothetical protein